MMEMTKIMMDVANIVKFKMVGNAIKKIKFGNVNGRI